MAGMDKATTIKIVLRELELLAKGDRDRLVGYKKAANALRNGDPEPALNFLREWRDHEDERELDRSQYKSYRRHAGKMAFMYNQWIRALES